MNNNSNFSSLAPVGIPSTVSAEIRYLSYGFFSLELLLHPLSICVSMANFALVWHTAVLHINLKWILLAQSISIIMSELCRLVLLGFKLASGNILSNPVIWIGSFLGFLAIYASTFKTLLSYVLLAERTLATALFRKYEHFGNLWCNLGWPIVLLIISGLIQFTQDGSPRNVSATTVPSIAILFMLQIAAIAVLIALYTKNKSRYQRNDELTLNQRFQLSENVRTVRQLGPTFVLYSLHVLLNYGIKLLFAFEWVTRDEMVKFTFLIQACLLAVVNTLIEVTMITHHPMLKRKAVTWIFRGLALICRTNRISDQRSADQFHRIGEKQKAVPKNLFGHQLINSARQEDHFRMLQDVWK